MRVERVNGPSAEPHNLFLRSEIRFPSFPTLHSLPPPISLLSERERKSCIDCNLRASSNCQGRDFRRPLKLSGAGSSRFRYSFQINYTDERLFGAKGDNDTIERNLTAGSKDEDPSGRPETSHGSLITESLRKLDAKSFFILGGVLFPSSFLRDIFSCVPTYTWRGVCTKVSLKFRIGVDHRVR